MIAHRSSNECSSLIVSSQMPIVIVFTPLFPAVAALASGGGDDASKHVILIARPSTAAEVVASKYTTAALQLRVRLFHVNEDGVP